MAACLSHGGAELFTPTSDRFLTSGPALSLAGVRWRVSTGVWSLPRGWRLHAHLRARGGGGGGGAGLRLTSQTSEATGVVQVCGQLWYRCDTLHLGRGWAFSPGLALVCEAPP